MATDIYPTLRIYGVMADEMTKTTFRLAKSLLKQVKQYALDHDVTDTDVFTEAIKEYLNKRRPK